MSIRPESMVEARLLKLLDELSELTSKPDKDQKDMFQLHQLMGRVDSLGWVLYGNYRCKFEQLTIDAEACLTYGNAEHQSYGLEYQVSKGLIKKISIEEVIDPNGKSSFSIKFHSSQNNDFFSYQRNGKAVLYKRLDNAIKAIKNLGWVGEVMHITKSKNSQKMTTLNLAS